MRKLLIIIFLVFAFFFISADVLTGFKYSKTLYYLCFDYSKNFETKKFYIKYQYSDMVNDHVTTKGIQIIGGYLDDSNKIRKLRYPYNILEKSKKTDKKNRNYFDVWYKKDIDKIIIKTDKIKGISYRKIFIHLLFYLGSIPAIVYLIRLSKIKNEENNNI
ncbi:hypothetical protein VOI54_14365 [Tamlana sp. 2201CG12-4]|uniref:hypothetical protein n=1 Tax=Tamlana sp. 2201CG12-4 TaxID=3112582 RepID=UPI002DB95367|nr:hypothetical protein [Tamlana sp. 2201CG12-4]MEC3908211.1 hypothetical protein [Tamlana sp. 2201CG12-4]